MAKKMKISPMAIAVVNIIMCGALLILHAYTLSMLNSIKIVDICEKLFYSAVEHISRGRSVAFLPV